MSPRTKKYIYTSSAFRVSAQGIYEKETSAELVSPDCLQITEKGETRHVHIPAPPAGSPGYRGDYAVLNAAYNMALHELQQNISDEGLLMAGANWHNVWTRDIAYAAALGTNLAAPEATRRSLAARVRDGRILQDTGTGGGWPVSTDRVAWAMGAWAYYLSSGDTEWLRFSAEALRNTLEQDEAALRPDPLVPGETSFLDWREQSYPAWMTPADIGSSYALSTNVLHYTARRILAHMLTAMGEAEAAEAWKQKAAELGEAIEKNFWYATKRRYNMMRLPNGCFEMRADALATALLVLAGLGQENGGLALRFLPRTRYGTPVFTPFIAENPGAYHNRSIWPFVEAYILLAHAEQRDMQGVEFSLTSLLRAALIFGTNKENYHATTGRATDTIQNSDRQLWSVAGMLGVFYHGLLGISYEHDNLVFNPCIPKSFGGSHWFIGLKIRNMVLDIHLNGYGCEICSVMINGKASTPIIPLDTEGHLMVELQLQPSDPADELPYSFERVREGLEPPRWDDPDDQQLYWLRTPRAKEYRILANGTSLGTTRSLGYDAALKRRPGYREYQVRAINEHMQSSPNSPYPDYSNTLRLELPPLRIGEHAEYSVENNQAWLDTRPCTARLEYGEAYLRDGRYRLRVLYSNATASLRDGDTCALRELEIDGAPAGLVVLPHNTEAGRWEDYTYTASVEVQLERGTHSFALCYTPACTNTNGGINQCMVRHLEITRLK